MLIGDISELYNTELGDNLLGGCIDNSIITIPPIVKYMENAVGIDINKYINSGVLVMNTKKLREKKFSDKFLYLLNTYHAVALAPDQDYINAMCHGKIKYIDEEWDALPNDDRPILDNPKLIHYNFFQKPWNYDNIQYGEYFWKYAKQTDFYEEIVSIKENYTDSQREADKKCLENIAKRAFEVPDGDEITLKKLYDKGVQIRL